MAHQQGWRTRTTPRLKHVGKVASSAVLDWPDVEAVHPDRGIFYAELKSATGKLRPGQEQLLAILTNAGVETHVWRPSDAGRILERLLGR